MFDRPAYVSRAFYTGFAMSLWWCLSCLAADFYVDPSSPPGGSGTAGSPFQTISNAVVAANAIPATVTHNIYLATGTYKDIAHPSPGLEDFSITNNYTFINPGGGSFKYIYIRGGYLGYNGGSPNWTEGSRIQRSTIIDLQGAGARAFDTTPDARDCTFYYGMVFRNGNPTTGDGGAIRNQGGYDSQFHLENCLFEDNAAPGYGGAVSASSGHTSGTKRVKDCEFYRNTAGAGGALRYDGASGTSLGIVENCIFGGNTATNDNGGGAVTAYGYFQMQNCTVTNNTATHATGQGGGVSGYGNASYGHTFRQCTFSGNEAAHGSAVGGDGYDAGIYILENCLLYKNKSRDAEGSAVYAVSTTLRNVSVKHCTIAGNTNGGIYANSDLDIRGCVIAGNGSVGIRAVEATPTIDFNNVYNHATNYAGTAVAGAHDLSADPTFVNAAAGNYRLALGSPSVDTATNLSFTVDLINTMRPTRNGWDQGCYEEKDAIRLQNLVTVTTSTNAVLRGLMVYDGNTNATVTIYWGPTDAGTTATNWACTNAIGQVTSGNSFQATVTNVTPGATYWFRCFASNTYDRIWADTSWSFDIPISGSVRLWTGVGTNALASNPSNWFGNVAPTAEDTIKLDNVCSNMTWDAAAPHSVGAWQQSDQYTGVVTIATGWSNGFDELVVSNDVVISGGQWTHPTNPADGTALYRLNLRVLKNLTVAGGTSINVDGKGYDKKKGPGGATASAQGGSHGGEGYLGTNPPTVYGVVREPVTMGSGGFVLNGGGAAYLSVAATATVNGTISANGQTSGGNNSYGGAGGSIFLKAGHVAGSGILRANGSGYAYDSVGGGGGRVAMVVTNDTSLGSLTLQAYGDIGYFGRGAAAGTVYKESTINPAGQGVLIIDNNNNQEVRWARTVIPTNQPLSAFGTIIVTNRGVLGFAPGSTFNFGSMSNFALGGPSNTFIAVRNLSGITFPSPFVLDGYRLLLDTDFTAPSSWTIASNGCLSHSWNEASADFDLHLGINGNLTVNGTVDVRACGFPQQTGPGYTGSGAGGSHGGLGANATANKCYGSILNPILLGSSTYYIAGGGAVYLDITGSTVINGSILAGCLPANNYDASGGSLWLRTATLSGTGTLSVAGGPSSNPTHSECGGGGGRMAIRLTGSDSWGNVRLLANGGAAGAGAPTKTGGAGTIYIETPADDPGWGRVYIDNQGVATNTFMEFPGTNINQLRNLRVTITNSAMVRLSTNIFISDLYLATGSQLDLNGNTCRISTMPHLLGGLVVSNGGSLNWLRKGTMVLVTE